MSTIENIEKPRLSSAYTAKFQNFSSLFIASIKSQSTLFMITGLYMLATHFLIRGVEGLQPYEFSFSFFLVMLPILLLSMVVLRFINMCVYVKPKHPLTALLLDLKEYLFNTKRLSLGLPVIIVLFFFIETFAFAKVNIPAFKPFEWDIYFMELDRRMHFGIHPWQLLQPVLGYAPITFLVNITYNTWFIVMWTIFIWQAFATTPSALRLRFFISFLLIWSIGGSIFAMIYSSAGPAFYEGLNLNPNPYLDLMSYLYKTNETLPIWALNTQEILWASYVNKQGLVAGISAMPSMHNASAVLFALLGWKISRAHGIALTAFAVMIFLGSIHLGWHYAVDGYLGAIITLVIWWIAGKYTDWLEQRPTTHACQAGFHT